MFLARRAIAAGAPEAVVLAVDIATRPPTTASRRCESWESPDEPPPWHPRRAGFTLGEAAVALRLARDNVRGRDAVRRSRAGSRSRRRRRPGARADGARADAPSLLLGQGTAPPPRIAPSSTPSARAFDARVPITSALEHFGHALGASGCCPPPLRRWRRARRFRARSPCPRRGRGWTPDSSPAASRPAYTVVVCRALGGACAALAIGADATTPAPAPAPTFAWPRPASAAAAPRSAAAQAGPTRRRATGPRRRPSVLLVRLEAPLVPPSDAAIGGRLLPSSILEMTPGFVAQLVPGRGVSRSCDLLVAPREAEADVQSIVAAVPRAGEIVRRVDVHGRGGERDVDWDA
jgi:hypothetical protein